MVIRLDISCKCSTGPHPFSYQGGGETRQHWDNFTVFLIGHLPCLWKRKLVHSSRIARRMCQAWGEITQGGTLCVHCDMDWMERTHSYCRGCSNESVANLSPQHAWAKFFVVGQSNWFLYTVIFATPPIRPTATAMIELLYFNILNYCNIGFRTELFLINKSH